MPPPLSGNIINTVAITAVDYRGSCVEIEVNLEMQCAPVIRGPNGLTTSSSRYSQSGVSVRRHRQGVRVAVPNCENTPLVLWILCEEIRNTSMIKFVISRGINLRPTSHGLLGKFLNHADLVLDFLKGTIVLQVSNGVHLCNNLSRGASSYYKDPSKTFLLSLYPFPTSCAMLISCLCYFLPFSISS